MDRLRKDQWSTCPNRVSSSFKLALIDGLSSCINLGAYDSGVCGFGWRFNFTAHKVDPDSTSHVACKTRFDLGFDPHLIASAGFGALSITVITKSLIATGDKLYSVLIPRDNYLSIGSYISPDKFTGNATIEIQVAFPDSLGFSFPDEFPSQRVRKVLQGTLTSDQMIDTSFCLFTRRTIGLGPAHPKVIFANSTLLFGYSSYLDTLLGDNGFAEAVQVDLDFDISRSMQDYGDEYGYDSDSDLEPESDDDRHDASVKVLGDLASPQAEPSVSTASDDSIQSSFMGQGDERQALGWEQQTKNVNKGAFSVPITTKRMGRFIPIKDTAFATWKALIIYLYTRELEFKPLKSDKKPQPKMGADSLTTCSSKSMYRLADKIGLPELQTIALQGIRERLSADNIVEEVFTKFSSIYPAVLEVEIEFLMAQLASTPRFFDHVLDSIEHLIQGGLPPYCSAAISDIMRKMYNKDHSMKPQKAPPSPWGAPSPIPDYITGPPGWDEPAAEPRPPPSPPRMPSSIRIGSARRGRRT